MVKLLQVPAKTLKIMQPKVLEGTHIAGDVPGPFAVNVRGALSVIDPPRMIVVALGVVGPGVEVQAYAGRAPSANRASAAAIDAVTLTIREPIFPRFLPAILVIRAVVFRTRFIASEV